MRLFFLLHFDCQPFMSQSGAHSVSLAFFDGPGSAGFFCFLEVRWCGTTEGVEEVASEDSGLGELVEVLLAADVTVLRREGTFLQIYTCPD